MTQKINWDKSTGYNSPTKITNFRTLIQRIFKLIELEKWLIREYSKSFDNNLYRGFYEVYKFKLHTLLIHKPRMLYYSIRNYTRFRRVSNRNFSIQWELVKPLTLTYAFRSGDNYCPSCAKLEEEHGYDEKDLKHAEFIKFYER